MRIENFILVTIFLTLGGCALVNGLILIGLKRHFDKPTTTVVNNYYITEKPKKKKKPNKAIMFAAKQEGKDYIKVKQYLKVPVNQRCFELLEQMYCRIDNEE